MFKILVLFLSISISFLFNSKALALYDANTVIKPKFFFDEEIITNIDFQNYRTIFTVLFTEQEQTDSFINDMIIENLSKKKYCLKISNTLNSPEIKAAAEDYINGLEKQSYTNIKNNIKFVKANKHIYNLMVEYISNELIWNSVVSTNIAQSIRVEQKEIDAFIKTHPNYNPESAYQQIISQKINPLTKSLLEQVKSFTYIKYIS